MLNTLLSPAIFGDVPGCTFFLETLLMLDPDRRLTAAQAAIHPWIGEHRIVRAAWWLAIHARGHSRRGEEPLAAGRTLPAWRRAARRG